MLHRQGWQGSTQGLRPLATSLAAVLVLLASCTNGNRGYDEADHSAFGTYVHALDTTEQVKYLTHLLDADTSKWEVDKAVHQFYADDSHAPLWYTREGVAEDADVLLAHLQRELPSHGLNPNAFYLPEIESDLKIAHQLSFDSVGQSINEVLPRLEYHLTKAYLRYTVGQRYGFIRPDRVFNHLDTKPVTGGNATLFDYEVAAPDYEESLRQLSESERMKYLQTSAPDNRLYKTLQAQLEQTTDSAKRSTILINMERSRWQVTRPEGRTHQVVVNIPAQQLWAICPDSVLPMKICCGAVPTKTPLLNSEITHMQVNPDWIIPLSIVKGEVAVHGGDSAYFAKRRYYIVDRQKGDTLDPKKVSSSQLTGGGLRVGQKGGAGNSLGRIVFRFANNFGVYLHDTNNRGAFKRERRTLSHGCVRVEKPFELACFLLQGADEWTLDKIRLSMDMKPETDRGLEYLEEHAEDPRPLKAIVYRDINPRVPVYIIYYTVYPNPETGELEFWPDLYGYDQVVRRKMKPFLSL